MKTQNKMHQREEYSNSPIETSRGSQGAHWREETKGEQRGKEGSKEDEIVREWGITGDPSHFSDGGAKFHPFIGQFSILEICAASLCI